MRELIERQNLEQQYKKLNPNKITKGNEAVKGVMAIAGTAASVYAFTKSPLGQAIKGGIEKKLKG